MVLKILTLLILPIMLTACSSEPAKELNIQEFSESVLGVITVEDELAQLTDEVAVDYYDLDFEGLLEYVIITSGTKATATEVAVFKLENEDSMASAKVTIEKRLEDQLATYRDYRPDQVAYIESALIKENGNYILLSVTTDNEAVVKLFSESFK